MKNPYETPQSFNQNAILAATQEQMKMYQKEIAVNDTKAAFEEPS